MPTNHHVDGRLHLRFTRPAAATTTQLQVKEQRPPLRVVRAFPLADQAVLTHVHNVSGGVLGGDQLTFCVEVAEQARAQITSTGATRVYRHRPAYPATTQQNHFQVGPSALLEYIPDPLIPFAGACYRQTTQIHLAEDAGLFYWEILAPGREAYQEHFAYDEVQLHLDLWANGQPIAIERLRLTPASKPLAATVRFGPYGYAATFYLCRVGLPAATWVALEKELQEIAQRLTDGHTTLWGVSTLAAHGLSVRALSMNSRALMAGLPQFWQAAKWALYRQNAIMPRKVY
ncbi:MAG: urease accessory protein UreD [Caldilineaceae bacterium]|nr:urease accessory protein UreD [Caldilineaceae bacterium]